MRPDIFNWIEFWSIAREGINVKPPSPLHESFDIDPFMDTASIPDEEHMPAQMTQQMSQVGDDLCTGDVIGMETDIKSETSAIRRDGETSDGRYLIVPIAIAQDRCATRRGPGSTNVRDEQEPTFVQESQMGSKFSGFFLYGAMFGFSSGRWLFRLFAERGGPVFDNSNPDCDAKASIRPLVCNGFRNGSESIARYALKSIAQWNIQPPLLLAATFSSASLCDERLTGEAFPIAPGSEFPFDLSSDRLDTSAPQNLRTPSIFPPRLGRFLLNAAGLWLAAAVFLTAWDSHGVSCPI